MKYINRIDDMGGALRAIEVGYQQREIQEASYRYQMSVDDSHRTIVGVNQFRTDEEGRPEILRVRPEVVKRQVERLHKVRAERDNQRVPATPWRAGVRGEVRHEPHAGLDRVRRELRYHRRDLRRAAPGIRGAARIHGLLAMPPYDGRPGDAFLSGRRDAILCNLASRAPIAEAARRRCPSGIEMGSAKTACACSPTGRGGKLEAPRERPARHCPVIANHPDEIDLKWVSFGRRIGRPR